MNNSKNLTWTTTKIFHTESEVAKDLHKYPSPEEKIEASLLKIEQLQKEPSSESNYLFLFFYLYNVLNESIRLKKLELPKFKDQSEIMLNLLRVNRIEDKGSSLSFLYGKIYLLKSSFYNLSGDMQSAINYLELAILSAKNSECDLNDEIDNIKGSIFFKLGYIKKSLDCYGRRLDESLVKKNAAEIENNIIKILKCLRLLGTEKAFIDIEERILKNLSVHSDNFLRFIYWEKHKSTSTQENNFNPLIFKTKKGREFYKIEFVIDTLFFSHGSIESLSKYLEGVTKPSTIFRNKKLVAGKLKTELKLLMNLEALVDSSIHNEKKMELVKKIIKNIYKLSEPDHILQTFKFLKTWSKINKYSNLEYLFTQKENKYLSNFNLNTEGLQNSKSNIYQDIIKKVS